MIQINNLFNNPNIRIVEKAGPFAILEHQTDLSNEPWQAEQSYFMQKMNMKKRQVICYLQGGAVKIQAGAMQWMAGSIEMTSGVKSMGSFIGNLVKGAVTGESAVKPIYRGNGYLMLEPTYRYLLSENVGSWGAGMVIDDGLFLAAEESVTERVIARSNVSSAILGGEGLFNLCLTGSGNCVLESPVPREELLEFTVQNDEVKIDGNMAIAWSSSLDFSVEKAGKTWIGSGLSGEGFVNVYRGSGKILVAPTMTNTVRPDFYGPKQKAADSSHGMLGSIKNSIEL